MRKFSISIFGVLVLMLTGCAATKIFVQQPYDLKSTDSFSYKILESDKVDENTKKIFGNQLDKNFLSRELNKGLPTRHVEIVFTSYDVRHGAARALAGALAGSDYVVTEVIIKDKETGNVLSKISVISQNKSAWGTTQGLLEKHADKIASYLKTGQV
ncbi:DUF4410 domain-containing protein [Paraglaciecola sp.]|uniref:DUF4410 domain-containing protein n=1 Tax=Paraglaciecola sp. TaxID=1920173 RepID=UPI0030F4B355